MISIRSFAPSKQGKSVNINNLHSKMTFRGALKMDMFVKSSNNIPFNGKAVDKTLDYYDKNADTYFESTKDLNMDEQYKRFLSVLPAKAKILDAGCGSGRDSKNFIDKGYQVIAVDASTELAKKASEFIGQKVLPLKFNQLKFKEEFDAVWACASLVHIPKKELEESLKPLIDSIKPGGYFYTCLKQGEGESEDSKGRTFSYYSTEELESILKKQPGLNIVDISSSSDVLNRKNTGWINILAQKV